MSTGWLIAFIILCIFFGPIILFATILGAAASTAPGTSDWNIFRWVFPIVGISLAPIFFSGYMAFAERS